MRKVERIYLKGKNNMDLVLKNREWKEFEIKKIFTITSGKRLTKADMRPGKTPFIGSTDANNGITEFISNSNRSEDFNVLGVNYNGSVVENFYHPYNAIFSDDVKRISFKQVLGNKYLYLFAKTSILRQKNKYQYGYKFNEKRMNSQKIMLPVNLHAEPDYEFMEAYMRQKEQEKIHAYKNIILKEISKLKGEKDILPLSEKDWEEFNLQDLFNPEKGNQNNMASLKNGDMPLVSAKNGNNGIKGFVSKNDKKKFHKHCLTLNNDGDGGAGISYYQSFDFLLDSHVTALNAKEKLSKYTLLFISRCITKQRAKFGHGYSLTNNRLKAFRFMLPVNENKTPDYEYMEKYMKTLELNKLKKYLHYLASIEKTAQK